MWNQVKKHFYERARTDCINNVVTATSMGMNEITSLELFELIDSSISDIDNKLSSIDKPVIVFVGRNATFNKGHPFINKMIELMPDVCWLGISETPLLKEEDVKSVLKFDPVLMMCRTPMMYCYDKNMSLELPDYIDRKILEKKYVSEAIENIKYHIYNMGDNYPELLCWYAYVFYSKVIRILKEKNVPFSFIMWGEGPPFHHILKNICKEESVPTRFIELGTIGGTILVEPFGSLGKSVVGQCPYRYRQKRVETEQLEKSKIVIDYLYRNNINRNVQNDDEEPIKELRNKLDPSKPTIVYYYMDDYEACIIPESYESRIKRSPIFNSSNEAADYLVELSKNNDWNLIFKPHPIIQKTQSRRFSKWEDVIWVDSINVNKLIDISDLTITIFSQIAFDSLIRKTPVLLFGYNHMKYQGCAYECYEKSSIEECINKALSEGFTEEQSNNFDLLFSKLCNDYYLYDDQVDREIRCGKPIEKCIEDLYKMLKC